MGALVHASSVGVYSPGPEGSRGRRVVAARGRAEPLLRAPQGGGGADARRARGAAIRTLRVVRLRPGLIFKREAGPEIRRLFAGPFLPARLLQPGRLPVLPLPPRLVVQCVHGADVGEAYRLAALSPGRARRVQHRRRSGARPRRARPRAALARGHRAHAARPRARRPDLPRAAAARAARLAGHGAGRADDVDAPGARGARLDAAPLGRRRAGRAAGRHGRAGGCADAAAGAARGRPLPARARCARASAPGSDPGSAIA